MPLTYKQRITYNSNTMTEHEQQLNLGLDVPVSLPPDARTAFLREAGFVPPETQGKPTDPDAHLSGHPPIGEAVYDAVDARTLRRIGDQIADVLETF